MTELLGGRLEARSAFYRESAKRLGAPEDQQSLPPDMSLFPETENALKRAKLQNLVEKLKGAKSSAGSKSDPLGIR